MANEEEEIIEGDEEDKVAESDNGDEAAGESGAGKQKRTPEEELAYFEGRAKRLRKDLGLEEENKPEPKKKAPQKSDELDYGQKAYLAASDLQIKGAKETEFVQNELKKFSGDLESLLENDYFKSSLATFRSVNKTTDAIPPGKGAGRGAIDDVDYYIDKPAEEVPKHLRAKVIQAKIDKENNKSHFYNS